MGQGGLKALAYRSRESIVPNQDPLLKASLPVNRIVHAEITRDFEILPPGAWNWLFWGGMFGRAQVLKAAGRREAVSQAPLKGASAEDVEE